MINRATETKLSANSSAANSAERFKRTESRGCPVELRAALELLEFLPANGFAIVYRERERITARFYDQGQYTELRDILRGIEALLSHRHQSADRPRGAGRPVALDAEAVKSAETLLASGSSIREVASRFNCSIRTMRRISDRKHKFSTL